MKIGGRHERDYFKAANEVDPAATQALAAAAISFALTFAGHRFVSDWGVAFTLALGVITLVAASIWSWQARRLLLARPAKNLRNTEARPFAADSRRWLITALATALSLLVLSLFLVVLG